MEILLRRLLGLYLAVLALTSLPAALLYIGVDNAAAPWWILPAIPLSQGLIFAVAGYLLMRQPAPAFQPGSSLVFPPVESLLQSFGVYFIVEGVSSAVRLGLEMIMFTESWWSRIGSFGAGAVWLVAGLIIVTRPEIVLKFFSPRFVARSE